MGDTRTDMNEAPEPQSRVVDRDLFELALLALTCEDLTRIETAAASRTGASALPDGTMSDAERVVLAARARHAAKLDLLANEGRLAEAQRVGRMGSYDWNILADTNVWSDELYRIYGTEPQSFNASYERFMGFVHPDDRDHIKAVHEEAFRTHEPYHTEERIVRADGDVRVLATTGEVAVDEAGNPVRIYGICRDITDQRHAEQSAARNQAQFEAIVESSPDAVLVIDASGVIAQANGHAQGVFGYAADELVGQPVGMLLADGPGEDRALQRDAFAAALAGRYVPGSLQTFAIRRDGSKVPVDVALGALTTSTGPAVAAFVRDVSERAHAEALALRLHDNELRRQHALEINDNVVQGLTAALYALETGTADAAAGIARTIGTARLMMNDLLAGDADTDLHAGDLVRLRPAARMLFETDEPHTQAANAQPIRVLLVDDADDIRLILRRVLAAHGGFVVSGEAVDGAAAIRLAADLQPDIIVLDMAMPVMDGLEALPHIREVAPLAKVIVLSGFEKTRMQPAALAAGAHAYIEKGVAARDLLVTIETLAFACAPDRTAEHAHTATG